MMTMVVPQTSVLDQISELYKLEDGWLDGEGKRPDHHSLDWLTDAFDKYYPPDAPMPFVYATQDGNVEFEWEIGKWAISLEIDIFHGVGDFHCSNIGTGASSVKELYLREADGWKYTAEEIMKYGNDEKAAEK